MATQNSQNSTHIHLTPREKEVSCYLAQGDSNGEIAKALGIDESTVRQHLQNLTNKLSIHGRGKLQAWAWKQGLGEQKREE